MTTTNNQTLDVIKASALRRVGSFLVMHFYNFDDTSKIAS